MLPYKNITEFFGLYKLYEFDDDRMIFQKDEDREVKKRITYNPEDEIWEVRLATFCFTLKYHYLLLGETGG